MRSFRPLRRPGQGVAPTPYRLLKKAGENFSAVFCLSVFPVRRCEMLVKSVIAEKNSVLVIVAPDGGEGEEIFALSPGEWKKLDRSLGGGEDRPYLAAGQPVDEGICDALRAAAERTKALRDAASLLAASEKSSAELLRRLLERGHAPEFAEHAVALLEKKGLLDESAACRRYADSAVSRRHIGRARIEADLLARGYSRQDARGAAEAVSEEEIRTALLWQIRRNHPALTDKAADRLERQKAAAALMRKGFSAEEIRAAAKTPEVGKAE